MQTQYSIAKPAFLRKGVKIDAITLSGSVRKEKFLRICLVPLDFELSDKFPYKLKNKEEIFRKIQQSLEIAIKNDVDIICFPELSFDSTFIEHVRKFENVIIICGSFYDDDYYNKCVVIHNQNIYPIYKINPAPNLEDMIDPDKFMKCGNEIVIFIDQDRNLLFSVLICIDFYKERLKPFECEFDGNLGVNLIFVPSYKDNKRRFQKTCDSFVENYSLDVIKVSDTDSNSISCVFGRAHKNLIERLKAEGYREDDQFENKLCEAFGEMILIIELSKHPLKVPNPVDSTSRIKNFKRYVYKDDDWEEYN